MSRLTDNDRKFGPITFGRAGWNPLRLVYSSGGDGDDERTRNHITAYAFGWVASVNLPNLLQPYREKHMAPSWDAATVARMGRDWYFETHSREYGFSLSDGHFMLYLGAQTHDSTTTQSWSCFLPWTQWRHVRTSIYDLAGAHFWTEPKSPTPYSIQSPEAIAAWREGMEHKRERKAACPKALFEFDDYDGRRIVATTMITEREWRFGTKWCRWMGWFRRPKIVRSLNLDFSEEVGPEKGSWKGGTTGHGIEMLPGELHEAAFKRYCEQEHHSKYRHFAIKYIGPAAQPQAEPAGGPEQRST